MKFFSMIRGMNLQLFAEGAGDGSGTGDNAPAAGETAKGAKNPLANVVYGKQEGAPAAGEQPETKEGAGESAETFDSLIKGKYKADFDRQVQDIVQKRLKGSKEMETALNGKISQMQTVLDELAQKYGVDGTNLEALTNAMHADDKFFEQEAQDKGMSVQQLRQIKNMERENESLRRQMRERADREQAEAIYSKWMQDAEIVRQQFPDFDLQKELENPQFTSLLRANVDVATAFQVIHKDELIPAAMQYTAREVQNKMANSVAANNARPKENGIGNGASAIVKTDVSQLTKADRAEIARRVARGERIVF
ncbi:MAG: hypothetical protein SOW84_02915 [Candidatus Faecousia sp.]|nr:hypothetical protein [Candidatus Faecousia sp.]